MTAALKVRRGIDRLLYALLGTRWISYRAARTWDSRADNEPLVATAAHDAGGWDQYWASGRRDLDLLLNVAREIGLTERRTAVEIGCGIGRLAKLAAGEFDEVVATDISAHMLKLARQRSAAPNVRYLLLGADQKLPAGDSTVDFVYAWTVFRHMPEVSFEAYLDESFRVLRPGGCLAFEALIRDDGTPFKPAVSNPVSEREYTAAELNEHRRRHRFARGADRRIGSLTPGTSNLVLAWRKPDGPRND